MSVVNESMKRKIEGFLPRYPSKQAVTLPALHIVQDEHRCVSNRAMEEIAELLDLHPSQISDTASFYGFFRDESKPLGKYRVWVCRSLPCMLRGGEELLATLCRTLNVKAGETTADEMITLEFAECLGACEQAPCILVNDECHGNMEEAQAARLFAELHS